MTLAELRGQPHAVRCLVNALETRHVGHAYFLYGPPGTGKQEAAIAFARALNCEARPTPSSACGTCRPCTDLERGILPEFLEVGPEEDSDRGRSFHTDTISKAIAWAARRPLAGRTKACVMRDVHLMSHEAANHFLKMLEEPPPATVWLLLAPDPEAVLPTVRSRCLPVRFTLLARAEAEAVMRDKGASPEEVRLAAELGMIPGDLEEGVAARRIAGDIIAEAAKFDLGRLCERAMGYGRKEEKETLGGVLDALELACAERLRGEPARASAWIEALDAVGRARWRLSRYIDRTLLDVLGAELSLALAAKGR